MPPLPRGGNGSKVRQTYGRQRSFLYSEEGEEEEELSKELQSPQLLLKRGSSDMDIQPPLKRNSSGNRSDTTWPSISRANSHQSMESIDENKEKKTALKASHELREVGQNHKFKDEIEYIIDGIRTKDRQSIRRSSCVELTRSMIESEFMAQVRAHQYLPTVFDIIHTEQDSIVISCLALMLGMTARDALACKDILSINGVLEFLFQCIKMDMDPMSIMPSGRKEIDMYNEFKDLVRRSGLIRKGQKVLIKSIVLSTMASIIKSSVATQDEHTLHSIDKDPEFLSNIIELLIDDLAWIKQPISTPDVSLPDVLDISRIEDCLVILERYALVSRKPGTILSTNKYIFPLLVQAIALCRAHAFQFPQYTDSMNLMLHVLQLLINITNGNENCCETLSQSGSIQVLVQNIIQFYHRCRNYNPGETRYGTTSFYEKLTNDNDGLSWETNNSIAPASKIENDASGWYDILLLTIGLLINMLETNPSRRDQITTAAISLNCKAIGDCFHKECQCEHSMEALEQIVEIYNIEVTVSEMTENQVLAAYLALLIGSIVGGNTDAESRLYNSVSGQSLVPMLELLSEFTEFNQTVQVEYLGAEMQDTDDNLINNNGNNGNNNNSSSSNNNSRTCAREIEGQEEQSSIHFMSPKASDIQESFFHVIRVLKDIENRYSSSG